MLIHNDVMYAKIITYMNAVYSDWNFFSRRKQIWDYSIIVSWLFSIILKYLCKRSHPYIYWNYSLHWERFPLCKIHESYDKWISIKKNLKSDSTWTTLIISTIDSDSSRRFTKWQLLTFECKMSKWQKMWKSILACFGYL